MDVRATGRQRLSSVGQGSLGTWIIVVASQRVVIISRLVGLTPSGPGALPSLHWLSWHRTSFSEKGAARCGPMDGGLSAR